MIIDEKNVPEIIIELIATSIYSDISDYKNRDKCWVKIPLKYKVLFLNSTAIGVVKKYLLDGMDTILIETPLLDVILSDVFMTNYLDTYRDDIEAVIKIYDGFSTLKNDMEREKRAMQKIWKEREKQIEKVISNTIDMYGSIKGIAGSVLQPVKALELPYSDELEEEF